jgi:hypothetical protein
MFVRDRTRSRSQVYHTPVPGDRTPPSDTDLLVDKCGHVLNGLPPDSGFAAASDVAALPLSEKGRERYQYYLKQGAPKAFAITEKRGWFLRSDDSEAMAVVLQHCQRAKVRCWLYAVDDRVVWAREAEGRTDAGKLRRVAPPTRALSAAAID